MYVSLRNYLRVEKCLKPELRLDIRKNLVLTNIRKQHIKNADAVHNERMNVYVKVNKEWAKQARENIKYYGLFNMLTNSHYKLKTHLFLKNEIIEIDTVA